MVLSRNNRDQLPVIRESEGDIGILAVTGVDPVSGLATGSATSVNEYYYNGVKYDLESAILDVATDPDEVVAAPGASSAIYLIRAFITNSGTASVEFNFESSTTAITHTITAGGNGGGGNANLGVVCAENEALNVDITSGTATDLGMTVFYITIDV